jgi:hypothetical protein
MRKLCWQRIWKRYSWKKLKLQIQVYVSPFSGHLGREVGRDKQPFSSTNKSRAKEKKCWESWQGLIQIKQGQGIALQLLCFRSMIISCFLKRSFRNFPPDNPPRKSHVWTDYRRTWLWIHQLCSSKPSMAVEILPLMK